MTVADSSDTAVVDRAPAGLARRAVGTSNVTRTSAAMAAAVCSTSPAVLARAAIASGGVVAGITIPPTAASTHMAACGPVALALTMPAARFSLAWIAAGAQRCVTQLDVRAVLRGTIALCRAVAAAVCANAMRPRRASTRIAHACARWQEVSLRAAPATIGLTVFRRLAGWPAIWEEGFPGSEKYKRCSFERLSARLKPLR